MVHKDYYVILGVSPTATTRGIRHAFRALAQRYHPDRVGSQGTSALQDIVEAYQVLSDPERRDVYDRRLPRAETEERYGHQPEPLGPELCTSTQPRWPEPRSILHDFMTLRPSLDALRARVLRNFTGVGVPKGERIEGLNVEILLSPDEARRGGVLRLGVPVFVPCTMCAGTGHTGGVACLACMGQGMTEQEKVVAVRLPPQVRHGTLLDRPLRGLGLDNFYLRLHIAVTSWG
jgi:DnaJ-class molecular chaperone